MLFGVRDSSIANALRGNEIAEFEARTSRALFFCSRPALNASRLLHNENPRLSARVGHMLATNTRKEDVARL